MEKRQAKYPKEDLRIRFTSICETSQSWKFFRYSKIKDASKIEAAIEEARVHDKRIIVEASIENAREIECAVITGEDKKAARSSLPAEIIVKKAMNSMTLKQNTWMIQQI